MIQPVGVISVTKERLRSTLSSCQSVQDWSGGSPNIYLDILPGSPLRRESFSREEWEDLRPFILIHTMPITYGIAAEPGCYSPQGSLVALFEQNTPVQVGRSDEDLDRLFDNSIGLMIAEIQKKASESPASSTYPTAITTDGPRRSDFEELPAVGDCQQYWLEFEWGIRR